MSRRITIEFLTRGLTGGASNLGKLSKAASALGLTLGALTSIIVKQNETWVNLENQIKMVTSSQEELNKTTEDLIDIAKRSNSSLVSTTALYTKLRNATADMNVTNQDVYDTVETINKAFAASGVSAENASAAILQLSQGFASGVLRGDEFNSVSENAPILLDVMSKALNVTRGDLRDMAQEGKLTTEIVQAALLDSKDSIEEAYGNMTPTVSASFQNMKTSILVISSQIDEIIENSFGSGLHETVVEAIDYIVDYAEKVSGAINGINIAIIHNSMEEQKERIGEISKSVETLIERKKEIESLNADLIASGKSLSTMDSIELDNINGRIKELTIEASKATAEYDKMAKKMNKKKIQFEGAQETEGDSEDADSTRKTAAEILAEQEKAAQALIDLENKKQEEIQRIKDEARQRDSEENKKEYEEDLAQNEAYYNSLIEEAKSGLNSLSEEAKTLTDEEAAYKNIFEFLGLSSNNDISEEKQALIDSLNELSQIRLDFAESQKSIELERLKEQFEEEQALRDEYFQKRLENDEINEQQLKELKTERQEDNMEALAEYNEKVNDVIKSANESRQEIENDTQKKIKTISEKGSEESAASVIGSAESVLSSLQTIGIGSVEVQKGISTAIAAANFAQGISVAWSKGIAGAAEAAVLAAKGAALIASIKSISYGSDGGTTSSSTSSSSSESTPSQEAETASASNTAGIENTAVNDILSELYSKDGNEQISVDFARRMALAIATGQSDGTIES